MLLGARKTEAIILVVLAEATKFSYEADTLRSMNEGLETQMKSLKARLAQTVSKSEFEAEVAASTKLREQLHALQKTATDLEPIKGLLQALAAPPSISVVHVTEFVLAVRSLQQDGLVETTELIKSMAGRVLPVKSSDLEELVLALDGPPARHTTDAIRVLRAMGSRWESDEVEVLLHECQGLAHLREILGANGDLESILAQEKAKRVAAQDEIKTLMDNLAPIAPVFDPPGAKFTGSVTITISSDNRSDTIYCTADGSHPTDTHHQVHAHRRELLSHVSVVIISRRWIVAGLPPSMSVCHFPSTPWRPALRIHAHVCDTTGLYQAKGPSPFTFTLAEPAVLRAVSVSKVGIVSPVKSEDYVVEHGAAGGIAGVGLLIEQELGSSQVVVTKVTSGGAAAREGRQVMQGILSVPRVSGMRGLTLVSHRCVDLTLADN